MKRRTIAIVTMMWLTIGAVHALSRYVDIIKYDLDVAFTYRDAGLFMLSYASWIVVTLVLLRILSAPGFTLSVQRLSALFAVGIMVWLPTYFAFEFGVTTWLTGGGWTQWIETLTTISGSLVFFYAVVYALTLTLCVGLVLAARARETHEANLVLESQTARATLELAEQHMQLMQSQLSPHFLFNALGAISYLGRKAEREALVDAIAKLGTLLRFTIENASRRVITIREELQFAQDYVGLQKLRFAERFDCTFACDERIDSVPCLPFSLQPMLENVFRHVVEQMTETLVPETRVRIDVTVEKRDDSVIMGVQNSRHALPCEPPTTVGHGTGMKNLRTRLAHIYGDDFSLQQEKTPTYFRVTLVFPAVAGANSV